MGSRVMFIIGRLYLCNNLMGENRCLVCDGQTLKNISTSYSRHYPRLFRKIAACKSCGHIQLNPLYAAPEYKVINSNFFLGSYLSNGKMNIRNNDRKVKKLDVFLRARLSRGLRVLDVGAGEAWALQYFMEHCGNYSAIEEVPKLCAAITKNGGRVIATSLESDLSDYKESFDVIVFRHTIEHLLEPKKVLRKLRSLLSENGFIFLALPNSAQPGAKKGFRTSYLRPVHISYFCEGNCRRLVMSCGFSVLQKEVDGEIKFLLGKSSGEIKDAVFPNYYDEQIKIFKSAQKRAFFKDITFFLKDVLRMLFKK